jgi:hypothetical protein
MAICTARSDTESRLLVASSRKRIGAFLRSAAAMQNGYDTVVGRRRDARGVSVGQVAELPPAMANGATASHGATATATLKGPA